MTPRDENKPMYRTLYCPICGARVRVETDAKYPEVHCLPEHVPKDAVNLCQGSVVTVTLDFDRCRNCKAKMPKNASGLCLRCFTVSDT
jgi:hypothetical protein